MPVFDDEPSGSRAVHDHLTEIELAGLLDGQNGPDDRRRLVHHLDSCTECRAELVEMRRIMDAAPMTSPPAVSRAPRWWLPLTAAAGLATIIVARLAMGPTAGGPADRAPDPEGSGRIRIGVVRPVNDATISGGAVAFLWHGTGADVYRVSLLNESGAPLWTQETADTSAALPPEIALIRGRAYFWRVDAIADGIQATSGIQRLRVAP